MTFDFVQQVKARTKSIHLDKTPVSASAPEAEMDKTTSPQDTSKRTCSLPPAKDGAPSTLPTGQAPMRRFRSMLEVDEPPKLGPWNPMSFDELYSAPLDEKARAESVAASSDRTEVATPASMDTIIDHAKALTCQEFPFNNAYCLFHRLPCVLFYILILIHC